MGVVIEVSVRNAVFCYDFLMIERGELIVSWCFFLRVGDRDARLANESILRSLCELKPPPFNLSCVIVLSLTLELR